MVRSAGAGFALFAVMTALPQASALRDALDASSLLNASQELEVSQIRIFSVRHNPNDLKILVWPDPEDGGKCLVVSAKATFREAGILPRDRILCVNNWRGDCSKMKGIIETVRNLELEIERQDEPAPLGPERRRADVSQAHPRHAHHSIQQPPPPRAATPRHYASASQDPHSMHQGTKGRSKEHDHAKQLPTQSVSQQQVHQVQLNVVRGDEVSVSPSHKAEGPWYDALVMMQPVQNGYIDVTVTDERAMGLNGQRIWVPASFVMKREKKAQVSLQLAVGGTDCPLAVRVVGLVAQQGYAGIYYHNGQNNAARPVYESREGHAARYIYFWTDWHAWLIGARLVPLRDDKYYTFGVMTGRWKSDQPPPMWNCPNEVLRGQWSEYDPNVDKYQRSTKLAVEQFDAPQGATNIATSSKPSGTDVDALETLKRLGFDEGEAREAWDKFPSDVNRLNRAAEWLLENRGDAATGRVEKTPAKRTIVEASQACPEAIRVNVEGAGYNGVYTRPDMSAGYPVYTHEGGAFGVSWSGSDEKWKLVELSVLHGALWMQSNEAARCPHNTAWSVPCAGGREDVGRVVSAMQKEDCLADVYVSGSTYQPKAMGHFSITSKVSPCSGSVLRPVYESKNRMEEPQFLYFWETENKWMIGPNISSPGCRVWGAAPVGQTRKCPHDVEPGSWQEYVVGEAFVLNSDIVVQDCPNIVYVSGSTYQPARMGHYVVVEQSKTTKRPIYQSVRPGARNEKEKERPRGSEFLFFTKEGWIVGPNPAQSSGGLYGVAKAGEKCPHELAAGSWNEAQDNKWETNVRLKVAGGRKASVRCDGFKEILGCSKEDGEDLPLGRDLGTCKGMCELQEWARLRSPFCCYFSEDKGCQIWPRARDTSNEDGANRSWAALCRLARQMPMSKPLQKHNRRANEVMPRILEENPLLEAKATTEAKTTPQHETKAEPAPGRGGTATTTAGESKEAQLQVIDHHVRPSSASRSQAITNAKDCPNTIVLTGAEAENLKAMGEYTKAKDEHRSRPQYFGHRSGQLNVWCVTFNQQMNAWGISHLSKPDSFTFVSHHSTKAVPICPHEVQEWRERYQKERGSVPAFRLSDLKVQAKAEYEATKAQSQVRKAHASESPAQSTVAPLRSAHDEGLGGESEDEDVAKLMDMGFAKGRVQQALATSAGNVEQALEKLLSE